MKLTRIATAVGVVLLTALLSALLVSSPSQAEPKKLKVSSSATGPWSDHLTTPLFEGDGPFVPADAVPDRFYLKNDSQQPARATLAVVNRGSSNAFAQALSFTTDIGGVRSTVPVYADSKTKCKTYVTGPSIPAGGVQPVDVTLNFGDVAGQVAMNEQAGVSFVLTLSQVGPKGKVDICGVQARAEPATACAGATNTVVAVLGTATCPQVKGVQASRAAAGGTLAATGAPRGVGTLGALGVALLAGGAGLLVVRRRRAD